jgi:hypothetical protein
MLPKSYVRPASCPDSIFVAGGIRAQWLNKVGALKDEWIIERRVQLLIDKGEYTPTGMWLQVCEKLREACDPIPEILGEDRLARFGAYREFQQLPHEPATEIADPKPDNW